MHGKALLSDRERPKASPFGVVYQTDTGEWIVLSLPCAARAGGGQVIKTGSLGWGVAEFFPKGTTPFRV